MSAVFSVAAPQTLLGAGLGALMIVAALLPRNEEASRWPKIARYALGALMLGLAAIAIFGGYEIFNDPIYLGATFVAAAFGMVLVARFLFCNWHDEDTLAAEFGSQDSYIEHPRTFPIRFKAVMLALLYVVLLAVFALLYFQTLFPSE